MTTICRRDNGDLYCGVCGGEEIETEPTCAACISSPQMTLLEMLKRILDTDNRHSAVCRCDECLGRALRAVAEMFGPADRTNRTPFTIGGGGAGGVNATSGMGGNGQATVMTWGQPTGPGGAAPAFRPIPSTAVDARMLRRIVVEADDQPCSLEECPPGPFLLVGKRFWETAGHLFWRSEYHHDDGRPMTFNSAGEYCTMTGTEMVQPCRWRWEND